MENFEDSDIYQTDTLTTDEPILDKEIDILAVKKQFKDFLYDFSNSDNNCGYIYRDSLKENYNRHDYYLEVNFQDLAVQNECLAEKLKKQPVDYFAIFEEAAKELADELTCPRPIGEEMVEDIQIILKSDEDLSNYQNIKSLKEALIFERKERKVLELKVLEMVEKAVSRWKDKEAQTRHEFETDLERERSTIKHLTTVNDELKKRVQKIEQSLKSKQNNDRQSDQLARYEKLLKNFKELKEEHKKCSADQNLSTPTKNLATQKSQLEKENLLLKEKNEHLNNELKNINSKLITYQQSESELSKIEKLVESEKKENNQLKSEMSKLKETISDYKRLQDTLYDKDSFVKTLEDQLCLCKSDKDVLNEKLAKFHDDERDYLAKIVYLNETIASLEKNLVDVHIESEKDKVWLEQIQRLEDQLAKVHEDSAVDKEAQKAAHLELWKLKKELANSQIDKRILDRELKTEKNEVEKLKTQLADLNELQKTQLDNFENTLSRLKNNELEYQTEIENLQNKIDNFDEEFSKLEECLDERNREIRQLSEQIEEKNNQIENLKDSQKNTETQIANLRDLINEKDNEIEQFEISLRNCRNGNEKLQNENHDLEKNLENLSVNIRVLKDLAMTNEAHLQQYENLVKELDDREQSLKSDNEKLSDELNRINEQLKISKQNFNEERSFKLLAEARCKRLNEDLDSATGESVHFKNQMDNRQQNYNQLMANYRELQGKYDEIITDYESLNDHYDLIVHENMQIKEETSCHLTKRYEAEVMNNNLMKEIKDLREEVAFVAVQLEASKEELEQQEKDSREKEMAAKMTIKQHQKLIEFLQNKITDKKKHNFI